MNVSDALPRYAAIQPGIALSVIVQGTAMTVVTLILAGYTSRSARPVAADGGSPP